MSNKLNNFWDDCLEEDENLSLNNNNKTKEQNYSSLNSNRTKLSTTNTTNRHTFNSIKNNKRPINLNKKNKYFKNFKNLIKFKTNNNSLKHNNSYYSILKRIKSSKNYNYKKHKPNINNYTRNKSNKNNNSRLSSTEIQLKKDLSECTFNPKLISNIKNKKLKEKLLNYSQFTMYERGQIFEMKKKQDNNRIYFEEYKRKNVKFPFKPIIHKCPSFKNVIFNESIYDSLYYFYSRMNSARKNKIYKNKKLPFGIINYEEIYKNDDNDKDKDNSIYDNENNLSYIYPNKIKKNNNNQLLKVRILNDKETELCKQNLHIALMNLELNKKDLD